MKHTANYLLMAYASLTVLAGCAQPDTKSEPREPIKDPSRTVCVDPRPQVCTREYRPVCARLTHSKDKTYATGCTACANIKAVSYVPGACPASTH